jgi:uncharacterized membrane protein
MKMGCRLPKSLLVVYLVATWLMAQGNANKGSISGLVLDSTGNPVPGATVVAMNTETGALRETSTNNRGYYQFAGIEAGAYDFKVAAFSVEVGINNVFVNGGGTVEVDVKVALNKSTERVDLEAVRSSITFLISL